MGLGHGFVSENNPYIHGQAGRSVWVNGAILDRLGGLKQPGSNSLSIVP